MGDARVRPVEDRRVLTVDADVRAVEVAVGERRRQADVGPVLRPVLCAEREQLVEAIAPRTLDVDELAQRGRERDRRRLDRDRAAQLAHQHPAALVVGAQHVRHGAWMLARQGLGDRRLVVEDREDRLEEHGLAGKRAAEHGRERPHAVRPELATHPRLRLGEPAAPRPRGAELGYRRAVLLGEPALEGGPERHRHLGVAHRRVADVEHVQP